MDYESRQVILPDSQLLEKDSNEYIKALNKWLGYGFDCKYNKRFRHNTGIGKFNGETNKLERIHGLLK